MAISLGEEFAPMKTFSTKSCFVEMLMGIVVDVFAMFPLVNTPSFGKGFKVGQHLHSISDGTQNFQLC